MLQLKEICYSIGERDLLAGINWNIHPGRRVGLVGPNGAGKTTLLRIIRGELEFQGTIIKPRGFRIGLLPQEEIAARHGTVLETVREGREEVLALEQKIAALQSGLSHHPEGHDALIREIAELEERFESLDGYRLENDAKIILSGLGFREEDFGRPLRELSGGYRMRVYLGRLLFSKPDLLLLDEPTNHFDLPSLEWLEEYLRSFPGSILLVSHDRYFLDRLAQEIGELDRGKLELYAGDYRFYEIDKEKRAEVARKRHQEWREERERQQRYINRYRAWNDRAVQVQSRMRILENMEEPELPPPPPPRFGFRLSVEEKSYHDVVRAEKLEFRYGDRTIFSGLDLAIYRGERVALIGGNGEGKTTLARLIAGELAPDAGRLELGQRTAIGYYEQHQVDTLDLEKTVYREVADSAASRLRQEVRNALGVFQFRGEDAEKRIAALSGGEKARVSLAKILLAPVNFLIMDEPTNHLDQSARAALEEALNDFDGTLLVISHDRYFLDKLVHRVVELRAGKLFEYTGNYSDYLAKKPAVSEPAEPGTAIPAPEKSSIPGGRKTRDRKRLEAEARQAGSRRRNKLKEEIETLEQEIAGLERRKQEIEGLLALPDTYKDSELVISLKGEYVRVKEELPDRYWRWEKAHQEFEQVMSEISAVSEKDG
ncbi:MAG: ABC-F family ATP-binding cassette domain-containing protein [Proteobacteria bacterium]|nr:ABC-F family ATP-binding cassette domain-containing protein [Pseudomonadota bacterium]